MSFFKKCFGFGDDDGSKKAGKDAALRKTWAEPALTPGVYGQFPPTFSIYWNERTKANKTDRFSIVDESRGRAAPLYAINTFWGIVHIQVSLHSGPSYDAPALGLAGNERHFRSGSIIGMPSPTSGPRAGGNLIERLGDKGSLKAEKFHFTIPVGVDPAAEGPMETFEWRREDVLKYNRDENFERRLVRVGTSTPERENVVAKYISEPMNRTSEKIGTFSFQGTGLTGELGQYWTLMAVMSLVRIMYIEWTADAAADKIIEGTGKLVGAGAGVGGGFVG